MNFDFSDDMNLLREQARRFLKEQSSTAMVRKILDGQDVYDRALWAGIARMGWLGAAVPEEFGGAGIGYEGLCVLAEELGRALAPVPFSSSVYLATEALLRHGSETQKSVWLPELAAGQKIGTFALAEGLGNPSSALLQARVHDGRLSGVKWPVADGGIADVAVVVALDTHDVPGMYLVDLKADGVRRQSLETIDPSREQSRIEFFGVPAERLNTGVTGWGDVEQLLDRAAVLLAFEQMGGAFACLDMATSYAKERYAFGRPIGSFQAIKHKLADIYIAAELARSNAYYGAWALSTEAPELPLAASVARVSSTDAFHLASKENIHTHGGMGFTWELDCHLYYRRAKMLALQIGSATYWKNRVITQWGKSTPSAN